MLKVLLEGGPVPREKVVEAAREKGIAVAGAGTATIAEASEGST